MLRRLVASMSVVSLLLSVAARMLWVRSCSHEDYVILGQDEPVELYVVASDCMIAGMEGKRESQVGQFIVNSPIPTFLFPITCPAFGLALPAIILFAIRRRQRHLRQLSQSRLCPACGYDLRASPEQCPEWGAADKIVTQ